MIRNIFWIRYPITTKRNYFKENYYCKHQPEHASTQNKK